MKIKELLFTFLIAYMSAWAFQYFVIDRWFGGAKPVPECRTECKKIRTDVVLSDAHDYQQYQAERTLLTVPWGTVTFSTDGGTVDALEFKHMADGREILIRTISSDESLPHERRNFMVAVQSDTPWRYTLESQADTQDSVEIVYHGRSNLCDIRKRFVVHKNSYVIDLDLQISPRSNSVVEPRLCMNAPRMRQSYTTQNTPQFRDTISAVAYCGTTFSKTAVASIAVDQCWQNPSLLGADSRYFVHALTGDTGAFAQRGYYSVGDGDLLTTIFEGPAISEVTQWNMAFYCGPKELESMARVDARLENTLDYSGILAPISKLVVKLLKFLYAFVGNYGFAIILLTLFAKLILLPFTFKSESNMRKQADVQKKLAYLQQRYKNDPEALNQERAELIRKHGLPGLGGCLPLLLQFPIFIALSRVLYSSIELYQAPMLWIPDLSAPDPYYVLPACVMISMLLQALVVDSKQKLSVIATALVFGALTTNFSSGLALYIFFSTLLGVAQTFVARQFSLA